MKLPGLPKRDPQQVAMIKSWSISLLDFPPQANLLVTELQCHEEGSPPVETVIAALVEGEPPRQWKLHKSVSEVTRDDIVHLASGRPAGIHGWRCPD